MSVSVMLELDNLKTLVTFPRRIVFNLLWTVHHVTKMADDREPPPLFDENNGYQEKDDGDDLFASVNDVSVIYICSLKLF